MERYFYTRTKKLTAVQVHKSTKQRFRINFEETSLNHSSYRTSEIWVRLKKK